MTVFQKRLAIIVGAAILVDLACDQLRIPTMVDHQIALTVLVYGSVIFANCRLWNTKLFWVLVAGFLGIYVVALWLLDASLDRDNLRMGSVFVVCLGGGWWLDRLVNGVAERGHQGKNRET